MYCLRPCSLNYLFLRFDSDLTAIWAAIWRVAVFGGTKGILGRIWDRYSVKAERVILGLPLRALTEYLLTCEWVGRACRGRWG